MKLSARNQIKGTITAIDKGPVSASVKIDVGGGTIITSTVTSEAAEELGLKAGDAVIAVIKATDVLIGK